MANEYDRKVRVLSVNQIFGTGASPVTVGVLPKSARIIDIKVLVETADNAGTSAVVDVGISGTANKYADNVDVTAIGSASVTYTPKAVPTADETIIATLTEAGTAATAGSWDVIVEYVQA